MKLKKITIKNFRGIKEIDLPLGDVTYLIGENNCGKTTILDAIKLSLSRSVTRKGSFTEYDYHLPDKATQPSTADPIEIKFYYLEDINDRWEPSISQKLEKVIQVDSNGFNSVIFRVTSKYDASIGDFSTQWDFLDLNESPLTGQGRDQRFLFNLLQLSPVFYLFALRDAAQEFRPKSQFWGPFVRSVNMSQETQEQLENDLSELNQRILESQTSFVGVKGHLERIGQLIPLANKDSVKIEALPVRVFELLSKTQVHLTSNSGIKLPLNRHGEGSQSLAVLFLFDAFLHEQGSKEFTEETSPILALEEPESHLHPSAARSLGSFLEEMKGQKIISTHSGDILSNIDLFSIRRLSRKNQSIVVNYLKQDTLTPDQIDKVTYHINRQRGHLLFARCWLFVEGQTEFWLLPEFAQILGLDFDKNSICCVEYRQFDIDPLIRIADDLGISWHLFPDNDNQGKADVSKAKALLNGRPESEHITVFPAKNIEHLLWNNGYSNIYENSITHAQKQTITVPKTDPEYVSLVIKYATNIKTKPALALEVLTECKKKHPPSIPADIVAAINNTITLAWRCQ